jgi:uncharacterized protein YjbI with pentapeptide repeats
VGFWLLVSVEVGQVANEEHLRILSQGVEVWNRWRKENPKIIPDLAGAYLDGTDLTDVNLSEADLTEIRLCGADLIKADLTDADLSGAFLIEADLNKADLSGANLSESDLGGADLIEADLTDANLSGAYLGGADMTGTYLKWTDLSGTNLNGANLSGADLSAADARGANLMGADLTGIRLVETKIAGAELTNCRVYGISAWRLEGVPKDQSNLIITRYGEPVITVDNLEVAQFIYLLLRSDKIRHVIDTITSKAVLILGRFTPERKIVLDAIRKELRRRDYLPIMFDFEKPAHRNTGETVSTLAHMSKFIIADITDAKSIPAELERIVLKLPSVPIQPLLLSSEKEYGMFDSIKCCNQVLETYRYDTPEMLLTNLKEHVIDPVEAKARELIPPATNR